MGVTPGVPIAEDPAALAGAKVSKVAPYTPLDWMRLSALRVAAVVMGWPSRGFIA